MIRSPKADGKKKRRKTYQIWTVPLVEGRWTANDPLVPHLEDHLEL
jgi:hypothetical protein